MSLIVDYLKRFVLRKVKEKAILTAADLVNKDEPTLTDKIKDKIKEIREEDKKN